MMRNISLNNLKYQRTALLAKITENRREHERDFKEASSVYRKTIRQELEKKLVEWERGTDVDPYIKLPKPVQYLREYDRAITQLAMTTAEEIELDSVTFSQLVLDEWSWKADFEHNTKSYNVAGAVFGG